MSIPTGRQWIEDNCIDTIIILDKEMRKLAIKNGYEDCSGGEYAMKFEELTRKQQEELIPLLSDNQQANSILFNVGGISAVNRLNTKRKL